jgi:hypothetical protein
MNFLPVRRVEEYNTVITEESETSKSS